MKKIGEIILIFITVSGLPSIIQTWDSSFYSSHLQAIWKITILLTAIISLTQFEIQNPPLLNRLFRTLRHFIFKTKNIAILFCVQILVTFLLYIIKDGDISNKSLMFSIILNIVGINFLVFLGKLSSSDKDELLLHEPASGKIYLYKNNKLKHIPDPETFNCFGFKWTDVTNLKLGEVLKYKLDTPITSIKSMRILNNSGKVYGLVNEKLKHIPDPSTLNFILARRTNGGIETVNEISGYTIDRPFVHMD